jgi:predicted ATPase/DNA-binding SARP family transcriptional activator
MTSLTSVPDTSLESLQIQLLGDFRISCGDREVAESTWRVRNAAHLVKLLALAPRFRLHREEIVDQLWPDLDLPAVGTNLRYTIHIARRVLTSIADGDVILRQGELIALCPPSGLKVDVVQFEAEATRARRTGNSDDYRQAIALYGGELLPGDRYEDWSVRRREALRGTYLSLLIEFARINENAGKSNEALAALQHVISLDPANEEAHMTLMRLYTSRGQRQRALRQYALLQAGLRQELDVDPDPASQRLYQDILTRQIAIPDEHVQSETLEDPETVETSSKHSLPVPLTSFIGRERERVKVSELANSARLLTLTGSGGCGKTRLALAVANDLASVFKDGVWFVELAALSDSSLLGRVVSAALGVRDAPGTEPISLLVDELRAKHLLLILDNCEHLVDACASLVFALLGKCTSVRVLATSREPLRVPGEVIWQVAPLSLPHRPDPTASDHDVMITLSQSEAVQLFVDRARFVQPTFALTERNAPFVRTVCQQVDGIPLAIELAAARIPVLSVEGLAQRLDNALGLLTGGNRTALPRHRTLRATLDWSYNSLSDEERLLLKQLSVFSGGCVLEAIEAVCATDHLQASEILNVLSGLVDKSLVSVGEQGGEVRYRLLETVRQYGRERLDESGAAMVTHRRHRDWCLALAETGEAALVADASQAWVERLSSEIDNLRAALKWNSEAESDLETRLRLAAALWPFWVMYGGLTEGRSWLEGLLADARIDECSVAVRAKALNAAGVLLQRQGDFRRASELSEEALALWQKLGDRLGITVALNSLCATTHWQGDAERARSVCEESLAMSRLIENPAGIIASLYHLGLTHRGLGNVAEARRLIEEAFSFCRAMGPTAFTPWVLMFLGRVSLAGGDQQAARNYAEQGLTLARDHQDPMAIGYSLGTQGKIALSDGDCEHAQQLLIQSLEQFRLLGFKQHIIECVEDLATVATARRQFTRAAKLLGAADGLRETHEIMRWPVDQPDYQRTYRIVMDSLRPSEFAEMSTTGRSMTLEQATAEALRTPPPV